MSIDIFTIIFGAFAGIVAVAVSIIRHQIAVRLTLIDKRMDEIKLEIDHRHDSLKKRLVAHVTEDKGERLKLFEEIHKIRESVIRIETQMEHIFNGKHHVKTHN